MLPDMKWLAAPQKIIGVVAGRLPTKGLALPFVSYDGFNLPDLSLARY